MGGDWRRGLCRRQISESVVMAMDVATLLQLGFGALGSVASVGVFYRLGRLTATVENHGERIVSLERVKNVGLA